MACPQEIELRNFGIYAPLFSDIEKIFLINRANGLNSYQLLNLLNPVRRTQITNMVNTIKARNLAKGKNISGGFYEEASFIGVVASLIQMLNTNIVRDTRYYPYAKKKLPHFMWV